MNWINHSIVANSWSLTIHFAINSGWLVDLSTSSWNLQSDIKIVLKGLFVDVRKFAWWQSTVTPITNLFENFLDAKPKLVKNLPDHNLVEETFWVAKHFVEDIEKFLFRRKTYFGNTVFVFFSNECLQQSFKLGQIFDVAFSLNVDVKHFLR